MAKRGNKLLNWLIWIASTFVGLAVGFATIDGTLAVPYVAQSVLQVAGWVVVVTTWQWGSGSFKSSLAIKPAG